MQINDDNIKPPGKSQAAEPSAKPPQPSPSDQQRGLQDEILTLTQNGENPWRLRQLLRERDAERVRQIDQQLDLDCDQALARLIEERHLSLELMQPFVEAMKRTDLTMPELILLAKLLQRNSRQLRKSLYTAS